MGRALRVHAGQVWASWSIAGLAVGMWELPCPEPAQQFYAPAVSADGRYHLWMLGEAFSGGGLTEIPDADHTRTLTFRERLLTALLDHGAEAVRRLDGEYQVVFWDARERCLQLWNDRFRNLPLYWARSPQGFAFAGGVRGVLMAPGIAADPDPEGIREAVSFGGFHLGDRTSVAAVKNVPCATVVTVRSGGEPGFRRYWRWSEITTQPVRPMGELVEEAGDLWRKAIRRRLSGVRRGGQTLSGGLDSRAILAEAAPQVSRWTAITYGVPGCDDARYAQRAAAAMGVSWVFCPLYAGRSPHWLERRKSLIRDTDGLVGLVDFMHHESIPVQTRLLDVHLSGHPGVGRGYAWVNTPQDLLQVMSYYGTSLGYSPSEALTRAQDLVAALGGVKARFAGFEHKWPALGLIYGAYSLWFRLRKPFVDYAFFEFFQSQPDGIRGTPLFEHWLRSSYPACYTDIPNHKTGMPVLTPHWRVQVERARRFTYRQLQPLLAGVGLPAAPRIRSYQSDEVYWRQPEARAEIEGTILRPGSLCCEILGRHAVTTVVRDWFERLDAPTQVIAALYVYENYHQDLSAHLRQSRAGAGEPCFEPAVRLETC
jgi:asparagine synthase (glutamine-hydrolysing)